MRFLRFLLIPLCLIAGFALRAQTAQGEKQPRILIVLDGSSSMLQDWEKGQNRFKAASKIIEALMDSVYKVNPNVEFALRVYGHQYPSQENNCFDTKLEVMFSKDNLAQMGLRLAALHPYGVTPIAFSIKQAAENDMMDPGRNVYSLILITDGGESCGGNLCDVVKTLLAKKIDFKPYILSLVDCAPLKAEYDCLGNYLLVTGEKNIKPTIGTIVEAYRPMITLKPTIDKKILQTIAANPPSVLKVNIPTVKIQKEDDVVTPPPAPKKETPKPSETPAVATPVIREAAPTKDLTERTVEPRNPQTTSRLDMAKPFRTMPVRYVTLSPKPITATYIAPRTPERQREEEKILDYDKRTGLPVTQSTPTMFKGTAVAYVKPPTPKDETPPPASRPAVQSPKITATKTKEISTKLTPAKVDVIREDAPETTLEIYFWDGKGKFYRTSPQLILTDVATKKQQKFFRTVGPNGNPDPQKGIPSGTYELTIAKSRIFVPDLEVRPNQKNVYRIIAGKASLRFEYEDDPNQPVKEYVAQVKRNFEPGPVIDQYCTQELEYEPGNYHIIINTLPKSHKSVDLDFDAITTIRIEKPGYIQFTNTEALGKISLYYELGDQFVPFSHTLVMSGNLETQKLELQRGRYRVGYATAKGAGLKDFVIKSKQTTEIHLD